MACVCALPNEVNHLCKYGEEVVDSEEGTVCVLEQDITRMAGLISKEVAKFQNCCGCALEPDVVN